MFTNEADQVIALDAVTGAFRWQYKAETPEEYTLRGHAGVAVAGDLVFTGFANGTLVALRPQQRLGRVADHAHRRRREASSTSTPRRWWTAASLYVTSSSGGVWALDQPPAWCAGGPRWSASASAR
jgi:outer membrane protein assembly factor BamB